MAIKVIIIFVLSVGVLAVLITMAKSKHFFKCFFTTAIQGLISLLAVNLLGILTGVKIAINWYTLSSSVLLGIPSSIALTILNIFFRQ